MALSHIDSRRRFDLIDGQHPDGRRPALGPIDWERAADVELLERIGDQTSGSPPRDLISPGVIAPEDVVRIGLEVLGRLAELCKTSSVSILDRAEPERG